VFGVWQPDTMKGAQIVNEPGSVNFNGLHTRDAEAARRFYGAVFGWGTYSIGGAEMWTLPGYGDHLEERDPGLRARNAEFGAEPGFEDVVASIDPIGDDQPDVPAYWSVTFSTDDADALAARAEELGGTVLVPPVDVPWSRMTVIADPQGATFIATQFKPENR
jgi:predicted enzyme related to lactoylglutathione lyase